MERIGKPAARPAAVAPAGDGARASTRASTGQRAFDEHLAEPRTSPARATRASVASTSPLAKLREGKITTEQYIAHKVEEATVHLEGLTPAKVAFIQRQLREAVASEPELRELVATLARRLT